MKILFIIGSLGAGGIEKYISLISRSIVSRYNNIQIHIYCCISSEGMFKKDLTQKNIDISGPRAGRSYNYSMLKQLLLQYKPDIIHSMIHSSEIKQTFYYRRYSSAKIFFSQRNTTPLSVISRIKKIFQYWAIKNFISSYTANGKATQIFFAKNVFENKRNIKIAYNVVEQQKVNIRNRADNQIVNIVYNARFHPIKQHKKFINAIIHLDNSIRKRIKLIFIGAGELMDECSQILKDNNLYEIAAFKGEVNNANSILETCDIGVLLSKSEGFSNSILEYMSHGLAVISSDAGESPFIFKKDSKSIVYNHYDSKKIANRIAELVTDSALLYSMKEESITISKKYTIDSGINQLLNIYGYK